MTLPAPRLSLLLVLLCLGARAEELVPPRLVQDSPARRPAGDAAGTVALEILIGLDGLVERARVIEGVSPALDEAALHAAAGLVFEPARQDGAPVQSLVGYLYRFEKPPPPPGRISGELRQKGRNHRLAGASVLLRAPGQQEASVETGADGRFSVDLPAAQWSLTASAPGLKPGSDTIALAAGAHVDVVLLLEPQSSGFEATVQGERPRHEVSRLDISGQELRAVPGTMGGDPFRAILALPGVASAVSGAGFPLVRGAAPASTGWFVDGVRLPSLFHLFVLSEVVHPRFIDSIEFYPSAYPAQYGQLVGGVVAARTPTGHVDETRGELSIDLINTGAFLETAVNDQVSVAVAGRYSYAGLMTQIADALLNLGASIQFWDYQARVAYRLPGDGELRLFVFGAHDASEVNSDRVVDTTFHRADLRWTGRAGPWRLEASVTAGVDDLRPASQILWSRELDPRFLASWERGEVALRTGFDASWKRVVLLGQTIGGASGLGDHGVTFAQEGLGRSTGLTGGAFVELAWTHGDFTFVPALRGSYFRDGPAVHYAVLEPRGAVRFRATPTLTFQLGGGLYHQGATAFVDLPGIDVAALGKGLQRAWHLAAGVQQRLEKLDLEATVYWSELPAVFEPALEDAIDQALAGDCAARQTCNDLFEQRTGRSVGFELMIRRRLGEKLFGWIAYTLSRTTRSNPKWGALPWALDQRHILNAVGSYQLGNGYTLGLGVQFHSGKPVSTATEADLPAAQANGPGTRCFPTQEGAATERCWIFGKPLQDNFASFFRVDARFEKSWLYDRHSVTFYIDVLNVTASREVETRDYTVTFDPFVQNPQPHLVAQDQGLRLVLPMIGVKGTW